jgi:hypothetical protein
MDEATWLVITTVAHGQCVGIDSVVDNVTYKIQKFFRICIKQENVH